MKVDVANETSAQMMVQTILDQFGHIDILVNNAAIFATIPMNRGGIDSIDPAEWDRMMAVNLKGFIFAAAPCCRPCANRSRARSSTSLPARH